MNWMRHLLSYLRRSAGMRILPLLTVAAILSFASCDKGRKVDIAASINPKKMPSMTTKEVVTFISDSGIIQYKIKSPVWYVYDERDTPYWSFPKSLYLEKYDRNYKVIASIACDSAKYFKNQHLWRLDGNVELHRAPKDVFLTQQLFWNEREHKLYSDSFIHIETATHILEGYGFISNDRVTEYTIRKPSGVFPFNSDLKRGASAAPEGIPNAQASPDVRPDSAGH